VPDICPVSADMGMKNPAQPLLYQGTTRRVPHICPALADMGMKNPAQPLLYQGTT